MHYGTQREREEEEEAANHKKESTKALQTTQCVREKEKERRGKFQKGVYRGKGKRKLTVIANEKVAVDEEEGS